MPTETSPDVGLNIRAEMGRQRVSMAKLSRKTGVPRSTLIGQIDSGRITVDTLVRIAGALSVEVSDLLPVAVEASA